MLSPRHLAQFKDTRVVEDLPGLGRYYCIECAKWFDAEKTLIAHQRGKPHKRRFVISTPPLSFAVGHVYFSPSYRGADKALLRVKQLREEPDPDPLKVPGATAVVRPVDEFNCVKEAVADVEMAT